MTIHIQGESTFAYHGLETNGTSHAELVKSVIRDFLEHVKFDRSLPVTKDHDLEAAVWTYFKSLNMGDKTEAAVHKALKLSVTSTHQAYTLLPFENKVLCAIQILYMFLVNDIAEHFMDDLRCFAQKYTLLSTHHGLPPTASTDDINSFTLNNSQKHPLLRNFDSHLRFMARYYGPYCHSTIIKSLFDYVNGRILEHEMEISQFKFPSSSRLMPMFLRTKVGAAEILVSMLWPKAVFPEETHLMRYFPAIGELVIFIGFTNEILSYYKEFVIREEQGNFVANFAQTRAMSHLEVLQHMASYTPQVIYSVGTWVLPSSLGVGLHSLSQHLISI